MVKKCIACNRTYFKGCILSFHHKRKTMPVVKLYYDLMSQPSRALYIFLKLTNIPFESHPVALKKMEHKTDEFKRTLNRLQKVPFIHQGEFKLAESVAILRYLVRENRELTPDHWYPQNSQAQARVDEYLAWQHTNTRMTCGLYFLQKWLIPFLTNRPPNEENVAKLESNMITCLDQIEELWLSQGHKYIASDTISIADIFAACELEQPKIAGFDVTKGRPILKDWFDRVRSSCNPFYDEAHAILNKTAAQNKPKL